MGPLAWYVRLELRNRWRTVAGLALLVGVLGSVVFAAVAGARRTADVYDRFADATATRDASIQSDDLDLGDEILDRVAGLDVIASTGTVRIFPVDVQGAGVPEAEVDFTVIASADGWGRTIDRPLVLDGRLPDPQAAGEVLINEVAARQGHLVVGDRISIDTFTPAQLDAAIDGGEFTGFSGPSVPLEVVGVGRQALDLQGNDITSGAILIGTPALVDALRESGSLPGLMAIRTRPGVTIAALRDAIRPVVGDTQYDFVPATTDFARSARDVAGVSSTALWAFAAIAAAAAAVVLGGVLSRQCRAAQPSDPVLEALGWSARPRAVAIAAVPATGFVLGLVGAIAGSLALSPMFPIGVARRMEPTPGARVDVVGLVACSSTALLVGLAWLALVATRPRASVRSAPGATRRLAAALPPSAAIGVAHAFPRATGRRSVPAWSASGAAVLAVAGVLGTATVVRSLESMVAEPARYGWNWSTEPDVFADDHEAVWAGLAERDELDAVAVRHNARVELGGSPYEAVAFDTLRGDIGPVIRSGRPPVNEHEIAIGAHTAADLGLGIGDEVLARLSGAAGSEPLEVVGVVVLPPVESNDPATGALLTPAGLERFARSDGYDAVMVHYAGGFDPETVEASLGERFPVDFSVYSRPRVPGQLSNLHQALPIVGALGAFFASMGLAALAHALLVGVRRRRRELVTLVALGMRRGQLRAVVAWTALASTAVALVVGVPLGLVAGRAAWRLIVSDLGLLDDPVVPWLVVACAVPVAMLTACALSLWPGHTAARVRPAALRSE